MTRPLRWVAAGSAAFVLVLIARFPASWAAWMLPRGAACRELGGTLWNGTCSDLTAAQIPLGDLRWSVEPLRLFLGELSLRVALTRPQGRARALVELSPSGAISARNLQARFAVDHTLLEQLPPSTHAVVEADLESLRWQDGSIGAVRGEIEVRGLTTAEGASLGAYRVAFPGGTTGEPTGRLSDLGGPFAVEGTVRMTPGSGYVVSGLIAARPGAPPDLAAQLRYLGTPDAEGRREFSVAGTL
jgi:general secretion pathway protein N